MVFLLFLNQSHCYPHYIPFFCFFQVNGSSGNCLYRAIKKSLGVCHSKSRDYPYFSCALLQMSGHGLDSETQATNIPEKVCCSHVELWPGGGDSTVQRASVFQGPPERCVGKRILGGGDEIILYVINCIWFLKITVLFSETLQEYCIQQDVPFADTNVGIIYNVGCHYSTAGMSSHNGGHIVNYLVLFLVTWLVT